MSPADKSNVMKSTIKIDYSGRGEHGVPVIKIVQPVEVTQSTCNENIDDVRDRLISEFLHTPQMVNRNHVFAIDTCMPHPFGNPTVNVTTISAIQESQIFRFFKNQILDRIVEYETLCKVAEWKHNNVNPIEVEKMPEGYESYVKIAGFFEWLEKQPYCKSFAQ